MVASIDPHGVHALSTATLGVAALLEADGEALQGEVDAVDHLVGRRPDLRGRVAAVTGDLAELAGWAREVVLRFLEDERPINAMRELGYWLPDFTRLGWDADLTPGENLERTARSDELTGLVFGTAGGLLERYRRFTLVVPRTGAPALTLPDPDDVVRGTPVVRRPSGLLVPQGGTGDPTVDRLRRASGGPGFHQPGRPTLVSDPSLGRPPTWARTGGRALGALGIGLTVYDSYATQWERDAVEHPEWGTGRRVASATYNAATEGGGAVAGGLVGAKIGAAVGSFIPVPVVGTVGGAIVGGAVGAFVGSKAGRAVGGAVKEAGGWVADKAKDAWNSLFG